MWTSDSTVGRASSIGFCKLQPLLIFVVSWLGFGRTWEVWVMTSGRWYSPLSSECMEGSKTKETGCGSRVARMLRTYDSNSVAFIHRYPARSRPRSLSPPMSLSVPGETSWDSHLHHLHRRSSHRPVSSPPPPLPKPKHDQTLASRLRFHDTNKAKCQFLLSKIYTTKHYTSEMLRDRPT
ncbi:hypothetical protein B0H65DRAFT_263385 [Neurospora tetraspora]|uniref:Uncharacterized protein n=1 Tax=Neurospora tetraspora TaxID=94610 RepID=A0AAE0JAT7_9PEZI|nr:hypothetical protein B0H65DRAFT_263385 [Neurospora tetraspora]